MNKYKLVAAVIAVWIWSEWKSEEWQHEEDFAKAAEGKLDA